MKSSITCLFALLSLLIPLAASELVFSDSEGVIRWSADKREVSLFGANYCLPSACDYRAAGYVHSDRKKLVLKDMLHFVRMGWDGMRLCFWGDWENCDKEGNLIVNDHLDLLDYAVAEAEKRGIYILFTPITTYASWWPDGRHTDPNPGFSAHYQKSDLGKNATAISAQCNYLRQILNHTNAYTGRALNDEPNILFVEMINEPNHHSADLSGSIAYINALVDAVRSTGCQKLLFHNVSQDFQITPAIKASKVQGVTFAWYPTGLNANHAFTENYLRTVDDYPPMLRADLMNIPKIVYEFDSPDVNSGYIYPAMARTFRSVGAQFMAMFSYDMLDTAPYNLGWQTHFLSLVYSPTKAMSAIIAAQAAHRLPRYKQYGDYPDNTRFGPFAVSYEHDSSELVTDDTFLYSGDTTTQPPNTAALLSIAGIGNSPVVQYEGYGIYFLDRLAPAVWRLELYPDSIQVQDPFAQHLNYQTVSSRLVSRSWPMAIQLPDLGSSFHITPLNSGNSYQPKVANAKFAARPGVYLLSKAASPDISKLPAQVNGLGLSEFICPEPPQLPADLLPVVPAQLVAGDDATLAAEIINASAPASATVLVRTSAGSPFQPLSMSHVRGYRYAATLHNIPADSQTAEYYFTVQTQAGQLRFPSDTNQTFSTPIVTVTTPLRLFDASQSPYSLAYTRIGDNVRGGIFKSMPAAGDDPPALRIFFPLSYDRSLDDYTASASIKTNILVRAGHIGDARTLALKSRADGDLKNLHVTLVESDGTCWGHTVSLSTNWQDARIPLSDFKIAAGVKLPLGFPGRWNYWLYPAKGRGSPEDRPRLDKLEHLQISFRPSSRLSKSDTDSWADIASVQLLFKD